MAQRMADGDAFLAIRCELRPRVGNRRVEIQPSILDEQVGAQREDALRAGEDDRRRVRRPRPARPRVRGPTPHVDDRRAVADNRARRTEVVLIGEVAHERVEDVAESVLDVSPYPPSVRQPSKLAHPFTDPWSSAEITWRWKATKTMRVGSRMMIVPAHSSGTSVA